MTKSTTIGLDIAKQVFQVHGADKAGRAVLRRKLKRSEVVRFFSEQHSCLVGIEARGSAHYWARVIGGLGHTVRLMAPQFVKPYVKSQKNDTNDAEAICEAVTRPNMRFVPQKSAVLEDAESQLSGFGRELFQSLYEELAQMDEKDRRCRWPDSDRVPKPKSFPNEMLEPPTMAQLARPASLVSQGH